MAKISKTDKVIWTILIAVFLFLGYKAIVVIKQNRSLEKNLEHTQAIVVNDFFRIRTTDYFRYEFDVNGEKYRSKGRYYPSDFLSVGDTVDIVYDRFNPKVGATYRDYAEGQEQKPFVIPALILIGLLSWWRVRKKRL